MLTGIYIEALLLMRNWLTRYREAWDVEKLTDGAACIAWLLIAGLVSDHYGFPPENISAQGFHVIFFALFESLFW